jgi:putative transposase
MYLNETGIIADQCWAEIPGHFKNVTLGEFVIMPNHTHGIINIERAVGFGVRVDTGHALYLPEQPQQTNPEYHYRFRNPGKNTISTMVGSFKSVVTRLSRPINKNFGWQTRFYDNIIRSHADYTRIANYILRNPANWENDKLSK